MHISQESFARIIGSEKPPSHSEIVGIDLVNVWRLVFTAIIAVQCYTVEYHPSCASSL